MAVSCISSSILGFFRLCLIFFFLSPMFIFVQIHWVFTAVKALCVHRFYNVDTVVINDPE